MAGSYRQINYSLRLAKAVERKMLCEAFLRLYPFGRIETYRYVGFGSIYFSDFVLFHRSLGIDDMLSIEKDAYAKECFEFNQPYRCVRLDFRTASQVLPEIEWEPKTIAWLDYDGMLDDTVLSDITTVCAKACSGSVLVMSVNAQVEREPAEDGQKKYADETGLAFSIDAYRLHCLDDRIGDALPPEVTGGDLRGKGLAKVSYRVINSVIREALSARNAVLPPESKLSFQQILHFWYSDGALMLTVGGVFVAAGDISKFNDCAFNQVSFLRAKDQPYHISVPCLTLKEMRELNTRLPKAAPADLKLPGVPTSDIEKYAEIYRYFPMS